MYTARAETIGEDGNQIGGSGVSYSQEFTDDIIIGGGLYADNGATITLNNSDVNVDMDSFTTEGGKITATDSRITSGIWANRNYGQGGKVSVTGGSVSGNTLAAQGADSSITIDNARVNVNQIIAQQKVEIGGQEITDAGNTTGAKISFSNGAQVNANQMNISGGSEVSIFGANVTVNNINAETGTVSVGGNNGALTVNGTANFVDSSTFALTDQAKVDVNGKVYLDGTSGITVNGSIMTFLSGSELHVDGNSLSRAPTGVQVGNGGQIVFANGSSTFTTASDLDSDGTYTVANVATATENSTITVQNGALLYVNGAQADGTTSYDISNVTTQNNQANGWAGKVYGSTLLQVGTKEGNSVTFENRDIGAAFPATVGATAFSAALEDSGSRAADFVNAVVTPVATNTEEQEVARVTNALSAAAGMTGLAGVAQGTYRFTTAFTDLVANHEEGTLWASYLHDKSSVDGLSVGGLRADYDLTFDGVVVGSDFYNNGRTTVGAAFAYADGDISTKSGVSTSNDVDYYGGMIYGAVKGGAGMTYRAEIGYNKSSNDLTQWNTGTRITGSVDADAFHVGVSAEKEIRTGAGVWIPFLGLQYVDLSVDDYSDSLGFRHDGGSAGLWNMPLGVSYKLETTHGAWTYAPVVTLGYRFVFGDDSIDERFSYNGVGSTFGTDVGEDSFFTRVGFEAKKDNLGFGVHYGYERGSNTEANQWGIDCSFYF